MVVVNVRDEDRVLPSQQGSATAEEILSSLQSAVGGEHGVVKFNISRFHLWDTARMTFSRASYSPHCAMSVKFMDDIGVSEGAVDHGGPRREFLQLLMEHLATESPLFTGPTDGRHLSIIDKGGAICACLEFCFFWLRCTKFVT